MAPHVGGGVLRRRWSLAGGRCRLPKRGAARALRPTGRRTTTPRRRRMAAGLAARPPATRSRPFRAAFLAIRGPVTAQSLADLVARTRRGRNDRPSSTTKATRKSPAKRHENTPTSSRPHNQRGAHPAHRSHAQTPTATGRLALALALVSLSLVTALVSGQLNCQIANGAATADRVCLIANATRELS